MLLSLLISRSLLSHSEGRKSSRASRERAQDKSFHKLCDNIKECDLDSDEFALGHHLFNEHLLKDRSDFDLSYHVPLLDF